MGIQTGAASVESSMEIPQKNKNGSSIQHSYPTLENISKGPQNTNSKEHKHPYVHCTVIYHIQDMEAAQVSISRLVYKTTMGHLHNGILHSPNKEENVTLCGSIDRPRKHYAKWNRPVRERQISYDWTHMWNLIKWTNKENRDRVIEREQADNCGEVRGWRDGARKKKFHGHGQQCGDCWGERI